MTKLAKSLNYSYVVWQTRVKIFLSSNMNNFFIDTLWTFNS